jgi:hypothetical protein
MDRFFDMANLEGSTTRLRHSLIQKRASVLERWANLILETYPADASRWIRQGKDRFMNPVGYTMTNEIEALYDGLLQGMAPDQFSVHLERILQIRSVQDVSPSQAVAIIPLLKKAIREEIKRSGMEDPQVMDEWFDLESNIDLLSLKAFDLYTKCREKIHEIRLKEVKEQRDRAFQLLERTNSKRKYRDPETSSG